MTPLPRILEVQKDLITDDNVDQETMPSQSTTESNSSDIVSLPLKHGTRNRKPPTWLSDFATNYAANNSSLLNMCSVSNTHTNFLANLSHVKEPHNYREACKSIHWVKAMQEELEALEKKQNLGACAFA